MDRQQPAKVRLILPQLDNVRPNQRQQEQVRALVAHYRSRGIEESGELSLPPDDALEFAEGLQTIGVGVLGLHLWYYGNRDTEKRTLLEYIGEPSFGDLINDPAFVEKSIAATKEFILEHLPKEIAYVSVVYP